MLCIINIVSIKIDPKGRLPPIIIAGLVCKYQLVFDLGLGILPMLHGYTYSPECCPRVSPRNTKGTEIPNHSPIIVSKVLNGTAPLLPSNISKKLRNKKMINTIPGNKNAVDNAFPTHYVIPKVLHSFPA